MHPAIIIGTFRSLIVDVAMGQIPRSTERISSYSIKLFFYQNIPTSFLPGCDKIDERSVDIFISYERLFSLVF